VRIGILSIASILSFTVLFIYSTNRVLGAQRSTIFIRLESADGLQRGDAVLHRGVNVGQVKAIDFGGDDVIVRVRLIRAVPVHADARAAMVAADVFGRQSIVLRDGNAGAGPLADGDTLAGTGPTSITTRIEQLGDQVGTLVSDTMIDQVRRTLHGAGYAATSAAGAAVQIGSLARSAEDLLDAQRVSLSDFTREAGLLTRNLRTATDPQELTELRDHLQVSARSLRSATARMDSATSSLARILTRLEAGHGSAGRFLTDAALYERTTGSLAALERLLDDVRANPKRYVTI
jgi:phospholipid/cholesterol/gamma-HCH transport system substrate-binding protein